MRAKLDPKLLEERKKIALETWKAVLKEVGEGKHPSSERLADLVEYDGVPTRAAERYVAERLRGSHRAPGRPLKDRDSDAWERLGEAWKLHEAVELYAAAYRMQRVRAPKTRAQDRVREIVGFHGDRKDFVRRRITDPLKNGVNGWRCPEPMSPAEATDRIRSALDAGSIALDRIRGWIATDRVQ